jgi:hypothetical protein
MNSARSDLKSFVSTPGTPAPPIAIAEAVVRQRRARKTNSNDGGAYDAA